jgi:serine-type D-Ala-D-Ala carboxypeptidase (penicillin-binding protein 5/6)
MLSKILIFASLTLFCKLDILCSMVFPVYFAFVFFAIFLSLNLHAKPLKVDISARSVILVNAETGAILYEKEPHLPCHPASIMKIATALYAIERKQNAFDEQIKVSQDAIGVVSPQAKRVNLEKYPPYRLTTDGTSMGLKAGEVVSFRALIYGLMLPSGNDAANVIAEHIGGTIPQFMNELNQYMKKIGCSKTVFKNPSGLPHPEQWTTASDMALLTRLAMKHPFFCEVVKTTQYPRYEANKEATATYMSQHNRLLKRGAFFYPKAIGVKTGFTDAGHTFVAAAKDGERTLIAVILYSGNAAESFRNAIALFEAAFAEKLVNRVLLTKEYDHFNLTLKGGKAPLEASLSEDLSVIYFPAEEPELKAFLKWNELTLPIKNGEPVGEVQLITPDGRVFKKASLIASKDVEATFTYRAGRAMQTFKELLILNKKWMLACIGILLLGSGIIRVVAGGVKNR